TIIAIILGLYINIFHKGGFFRFGDDKMVEDTVKIDGKLEKLDINIDACNLTLEYGREGFVSYKLPKSMVPDIEVKNSELTIKSKNQGFSFGVKNVFETPQITVVIPEGTAFDKAKIDVDAGNIEISDIVADKIDLDVDAGNVEIKKATVKEFKTDVDAGNVDLKDSIIDKFVADVDAGNIEAHDCTINGGNVETDLGNIELNGAIGDVKTKTSLGNVDINGK
ncbi:MAG: DUF4097 domain-containing protein, partial [Lachnospiraceae bacterium]|nr:DUF4097 domain-containing protein [Lachnospiraceae bacterium]